MGYRVVLKPLMVGLAPLLASCGQQTMNKVLIQNGTNGHAPFVSQIESSAGDSLAFCTGAWIAPQAMLTADHCVRGKDLIEYYPLSGPNEGVALVGRGVLLHPTPLNCMQKTLHEREICLERESLDVALVIFRQAAAPATVPLLRSAGALPPRATIYGYGTTQCGTATERVLYSDREVQKLNLPLASPTAQHYTMRFAIQPQGAVGQVCQGDSGGPWIDEQTGALFAVTSAGAQFADGTSRLYGAAWESVSPALLAALKNENVKAAFAGERRQ
ncbi:MAG TPA: trypsin-like serine protease [Oligoflexus sp.]|uniref:trypsin-like serine protease n=1 Tax=Oligoflexus sp. TaxID=1971216 RepID=UPI002D6C55B0|nr:trypsin-like serine protease [Oligoflexus sp.]HYX38795.1 trypsin-like serine protease [Oligoflexus sp.]